MPLKAVLFDIGGTLVANPFDKATRILVQDLVAGGIVQRERAAELLGCLRRADAELDSPIFSHFLGEPAIFGHAFELAGVPADNDLVSSSLRTYREAVRSLYTESDELKALPDSELRKLLVRLRSMGLALGIVSNERASSPEFYCEVMGISPSSFDVIVTSESFKGIGKPDPSIFLHALDVVSVAPQEAIYVGDSIENDVVPCLALGILAVWATRFAAKPHPTPVGQPDYVIDDLRSLPEVLKRAAAGK
jgi:HAD superfamily hydrolase (TIGR01509 family)